MTTSSAVLADAQFGIRKVFRPFDGFKAVYTGQDGDIPIAMPGVLDQNVNKEEFDDNLLAGISTPLGAKALVWIPSLPVGAYSSTQAYRYRFLWRLRNLYDFQNGRKPFHAPITVTGPDGKILIFAAQKTITVPGTLTSTFDSSAPTMGAQVTSRTAIDGLNVSSLIRRSPLTPNGANALIQQGVPHVGLVTFNPIWMQCEGDELIILVDKVATGEGEPAPWNFAGGEDDFFFGEFFSGNDAIQPVFRQELGVYVFTGSNP